MKTILSIVLSSLVCLSIFGCNKNTNYTTAAPYLKYQLEGNTWSTIVNYKLGRAMGVLGKIEDGLKERGYKRCVPISVNCYTKDQGWSGTENEKFIWVLFDREKPISDYGVVPIRFELDSYIVTVSKDWTVRRLSSPFDQSYLEMMKDLDETIVRIRD
jgi:hypothetical protein